MIHTIKRKIYMGDTDATGALYFAGQFRLALEAFESYLAESELVLKDFLLPIVHAEADFSAPLKLWDEVTISLSCTKIGTTSFVMESELSGYGRVQIVHVFTDKKGNKQPISPALKLVLSRLVQAEKACQTSLAVESSE